MKIFAKNVWDFVSCASRCTAPKRRYFAKFLSQNTSNNLKIVCQFECASPDNLWQLMGTAWAWQYRYIRLGYALNGIMWQIWPELTSIIAILS